MGERRMFNKQITRSDAFLDMPRSTRLLYYDLNLDADDDGFVDKYKSIMRLTGASEDDLKILIAKSFVIPFETGVIVIKHWKINNLIRNDRHKPTTYQEEKSQLLLKENGAYTIKTTKCLPNDNQRYPQYNTNQDKLIEVNINQDNTILSVSSETNTPHQEQNQRKYQEIFNHWISKKSLIQHKTLTDNIAKAIDKALKIYDVPTICLAINRYDVMLRSTYWLNYKWSLEDFLSQKNALPDFLDDGSKWVTFRDEAEKNPLILPKEERPEASPKDVPVALKKFYDQI